jgi:hypothetical protein
MMQLDKESSWIVPTLPNLLSCNPLILPLHFHSIGWINQSTLALCEGC